MACSGVRIQVFSPWPGDWRPEHPGPPNNRVLRQALEARGLLETWFEPPEIPLILPQNRWGFLFWRWRLRKLQNSISPLLRPDCIWLSLSPWVYPPLFYARPRTRVVLKTFGFVTYAHGFIHRLRMPELTWALRHPPDLWIATDDGSRPPQGFPPPGLSSNHVLWVSNARPDKELAQPLPPAPPFRVLFVGSLNKLKGADRLLKIVQALSQRRDVEFWIVGDGPLRTALTRSPQVRWLGILHWEETLKVYPQVHLLVHLTRYADWTLPLVESLHATRGVYALSNGRGPERLKEGQGVRWFTRLSGLIEAIQHLTIQEVQALHRGAEAGRNQFPTWQEAVEREIEGILKGVAA